MCSSTVKIITCVMVGHGFVNEVQTIVQVFFPWAKIDIREYEAGEGGLVAGVTVVARVDNFCAGAEVLVAGEGGLAEQVAAHSVRLDDAGVRMADLPPRRVLMIAMYRALQAVVPTDAPWGALTGIRPSKMVRAWLEKGKTDAEIIRIMTEVLCARADKARLAIQVSHAENRVTRRIFARTAGSPIGIYISIPFCPTRCAYCSFNMAHRLPARSELVSYIDVLVRECREKASEARRLGTVVSIYIGGSTPTVLPDDLLEKLLETVGENFLAGRVNDAAPPEFTIEAGRPDTLTPGNLRLMRHYGANRIAVNPQTLNDRTLTAIGRGHTAADFFRAYALARDAGFECINTDLIAALPGEGADDLRRSVEGILPLAPENITVHTFSVKRASRLNEAREAAHIVTNAQEATRALSDAAVTLTAAGYSPYYLYRQKHTAGLLENVGYALPNHECLYNVGMMSEVHTVLGMGAAAVTKYVDGAKISRVFNEKNPEIYVQRRLK